MWTGEQAPPPLPPHWEADTISCGNRFDWKFERAAALSSSPGVWRGRISLRTTLSQIPLKSFGFPGAESARKRFFLRGGASPHSEKISSRGRPTEIFDFAWSVAKRLACPLGKQPFRRAGRRPRLEVERVHTLSSSPGAVLLRDWFPTMQAILLRTLFPTARAWGALLPYTPSGDGVREGSHPLVRSRGLVWRGIGFPLVREAVPVGISFLMDGVGASVLVGVWFSTVRGVGRSAPLHPLGGRGARGSRPSRALPGLL